MRELILLVDDNILPMQFYVKALQDAGFEVKQCLNPDEALEFTKKEKSRIKAIILDIMMPHGKTYNSKETNGGLKTGTLLYDSLKTLCPSTPIIVLTIVNKPEKLKKFHDIGIDVEQKVSCPPFKLVEIVRSVLSL